MKLYELTLSDENLQGVNCISVVGDPAIESSFVALSKENKKFLFKEVDKKKLTLMGVIMKPNKIIKRVDEETNENYEVFFSANTIKRISQLYFKNSNHKVFNLEHNSQDKLQGYLTESWIVEDVEKDKSAIYNLNADVGDWVGTLKFDNEDEYNRALLSGTGFSIEGMFKAKVTIKKANMDFNTMKNEVVNELKSLFSKQVKLAQVKSQDGTLTMEYDGDMPMAGIAINLVTPEGNVPVPVGDYVIEDGSTIKVGELGVITEVVAFEELAAETAPIVAPNAPDVSDLKQAISSMLIKFNSSIETRFTALETKLSEQTKINEALKVELAATPAVTKMSVAPNAVTTKEPTTSRGRLALSLTQLKK
jgi:flagellar basal body rod protein FlgC